jgi:hypothetical protein
MRIGIRVMVCATVVAVFLAFVCKAAGAELRSVVQSDEKSSVVVVHIYDEAQGESAVGSESGRQRECPFKSLVNGFFGSGCNVNYRLTGWILSDKCDVGPMKEPF